MHLITKVETKVDKTTAKYTSSLCITSANHFSQRSQAAKLKNNAEEKYTPPTVESASK